eukprot:11135412-Ditylum_brightwellii.AAC.2
MSATTLVQQDLLQSVLGRTMQLEAQSKKVVPQEAVQMMKHTQQLEQKQTEYDNWKATFLAELEDKFQAQNEKIDQVEDHLTTQGGKLDQLVTSMEQILNNYATSKDFTSMTASNNVISMQINSLCAWIENIERENCIPRSPVTTGPSNAATNKGPMNRSTSPPPQRVL